MSQVSTLRATVIPRATAISNTGLVIGGVAFLAAMAQISFPIPGSPVPVTGQTLAVLLLGSAYGASLGFTTFALYLLIGIAGVPVFADGSHGLTKVVGATGGYLVGMLLASLLTGALAGRKWDQKIRTVIPSMLLGNLVIFAAGLIWLQHVTGQNWNWTISKGLTPFIIGEVLKVAIASTTLPTLWRFVPKK
jgi:biotin transport system substrate-specific component